MGVIIQGTETVFEGAVRRIKVNLPMLPPMMRADVTTLLNTMMAQANAIKEMRGELDGARQTIMVVAKKNGPIDIVFEDVDALSPRDSLQVEDVLVDEVQIKRFTFVPAPPVEQDKGLN